MVNWFKPKHPNPGQCVEGPADSECLDARGLGTSYHCIRKLFCLGKARKLYYVGRRGSRIIASVLQATFRVLWNYMGIRAEHSLNINHKVVAVPSCGGLGPYSFFGASGATVMPSNWWWRVHMRHHLDGGSQLSSNYLKSWRRVMWVLSRNLCQPQ